MQDEAFNRLVGGLDRPMIVVTASVDGERAGCLVGFHAQSSIDPSRYSLWLSKANHTYRVAQYATHFGVHFLAESDRELAKVFGTLTGDQVDKFAGLDVRAGAGDAPILTACANTMVVRKHAVLDEGGDHVCVVTEPVEVHDQVPFAPLLLSHVKDLEPGHPAEDRDEPSSMRAD